MDIKEEIQDAVYKAVDQIVADEVISHRDLIKKTVDENVDEILTTFIQDIKKYGDDRINDVMRENLLSEIEKKMSKMKVKF